MLKNTETGFGNRVNTTTSRSLDCYWRTEREKNCELGRKIQFPPEVSPFNEIFGADEQ